MRCCRLALFVIALLAIAGTVRAQSTVQDALAFLVTNQSVDTGSVERDSAAAAATSRTISRAVLVNLATLPVSSTSGAFAYRLNPALGTVERSTQTFGPMFVDRAVAASAGTAGVGVTFQHLHFTALDGRNLRNGSLVTTAHQFVDEPEPFDIDRLTLEMDADIATVYGSVGLGHGLDVGAAVPIVWMRMNGSRVNTYRGREFTQATAQATAVGLADVLVRGKATLFEEDGASLAAAVDVRLPTGREADLLGAGAASVRVAALGSLEGPTTAAHANIGIARGGLASEITYGAAVAVAATPVVTIGVEAFGRSVDTPGDIVTMAQPHPSLAGVETLRLLPGTRRLTTLAVAPGIRWNVTDTWVLVGTVGLPLLRGGLRAPLLPFAGLEYSMGR